MTREYYTFVSVSTALGILRWVAAIALVALAVFFLVRQIKTKKSLSFITTFISALILVPMLILAPVQVKIEPGTPEPQPVDPIPQVDPEPEPTPEPEPEPISPVTPSNNTPNTKPSDNQTPSTPDEPETPSAPDEPDAPDAPEEPEVSAKYTVIHRQQNLENDDYTVVESESKTGVAGKTATPDTKTYAGFIAPAAKTATIAKDGSTEIVYDYNRELIALVLEDTDDTTSSLPAGNYKYGTQVTLTAKDRTGYVFANWSNGETTKNISIELTEATSIKPIYTPNTYLVGFNKNNSAATGSMSTQTLTYDQAEKLSKNSFILEGYTFDHWNTESNDTGNRYANEESVQNLLAEGEITLYAFWTANTNTAYTVSHYKQNIGGGDNYALARTEDKTGTTDTMATPNRESYTGFTAPAAQSKKITGDGHMVIDYYYTRNQYTITFGDNSAQISSDTFTSGQKYYYEQTGTLTAGTKNGYTFTGWSDNVTDASRSFTVGAEDAIIGANYRANNYTVVFHANYPGSTATATQSFTYDQAETALEENSFSRAGYQFDHWNENASDAGQGYSDKEPVQNLTAEDGGEYHLYAQWTAKKYTIAFDKNADDATGSMNPQGMTYDQAANLSTNQFQRSNFNFKGWSTDPNATAIEYGDGEEVSNLATSGAVTLYAVWEDKFPVVFSVEGDCIFNGKDGTITTSSTCQFGDTNFVGQTFVDTGISLNTSENFDKDYEISFNIDSYSPNQVEAQAAFVSNKISTTHPTSQLPNPPSPLPQAKSPGVVVRKSGNNIDIRSALLNETGSGYLEANYIKPYTEFQTIKLVRHNRVVYISMNGGNLFELQDVSGFNQYFNQTTWFGAYPNDGTEDPEPKNVLVGTLSNLSIRLGEMDWNYYQVEFDAKSGTLDNSYKKMQIEKGTSIETLPVTTRKKYIFDGWFIGNTQISDGYTPTEDVKIIAKWARNVQQAIASPSSFELTRGDEAYLTITNKNNIEPFTMSSSNDQIATIDQDGKVTAVSNGQANIVLTGSRSGETFEIPVTVTLPRYTVHFDTKGGNEIADITDVEEGSSIGTLPADPTRTGYVFNGWFLKNSTTAFAADTPVMGNITVEAHWLKDITNAIVSNINLTRGESAQITVTNADELEPYGYRNGDTSIATVDDLGNVTAVSAGTTRIALVGSYSMLEQQIDVTVDLPKYVVHFNAHGGSDVADITGIAEGDSISTLPTSSLEHYILDGWYTTENGGEKLTTSTPIMGETTYHAHWIKDVTQAAINTNSMELEIGTTGNIAIDNASDIEQFEFASGDNSIATIDDDGTVTAVANGTTTIGIRGVMSGEVVQISVTVYTNTQLTFVPQNGNATIAYTERVGEALQESDLPGITRSGYIFDGWFTEASEGVKLETPYTVTGEAVFYAHWTFDTMPIVWQHQGQCEFEAQNNGNSGLVKGENCDYAGDQYIDTGVSLYSDENIGKAYEVYFEIDEYDYTKQIATTTNDNKQQTFFNAKDSSKINSSTDFAAGLIIRRSDDKIEINTNAGGSPSNNEKITQAASDVKKIRVKREYNPANGKAIITMQTYNEATDTWTTSTKSKSPSPTDPTYHFSLSAWFGAYPDGTTSTPAEGAYTPKKNRFLTGKLSNMYIKLEAEEPATDPEIVAEHYVESEAVRNYLANIDEWKGQERYPDDRDYLYEKLKNNFDGNKCKTVTNTGADTSTDFSSTYKYREDGTVYCDRSNSYNTGVSGPVKVYLSDEIQRNEGEQVAYAGGNDGRLINLIPGETYKWVSEADSNVYGYVKAIGTRRMISLTTARNVRDLGGMVGLNGQKLKYGVLLRGEQLDDADVATLQQDFGINYEYDLRRGVNDQKGSHFDGYRQDLGMIHYNINTDKTTYYGYTRSVLKQLMEDVRDGKSIYFHCSHGADRTGTLAYLAEALLGVDYETRARDYELTSLSGRPDRTRFYHHKGTNPTPNGGEMDPTTKYLHMISFIKTNEEVEQWFYYGSGDNLEYDQQLVADFRAAMLEN